jgi:NAD+ kinase
MVDRAKLEAPHSADLIVSVGGDGTALACAHKNDDTPILAVNFMPRRSVGFFCAATARNFKRRTLDIMKDRFKPRSLPLLAVNIDGKDLGSMALNDVLFASPCPAEMSRYKLIVGRHIEAQRSSGVWVSAGPGSTAAITSAGGRRMELDSPDLQYLVREPCPMPNERYELIRGIVPAGTRLAIRSDMSNAVAYLDGHELSFPIPRGATLSVRSIPDTLKLYI